MSVIINKIKHSHIYSATQINYIYIVAPPERRAQAISVEVSLCCGMVHVILTFTSKWGISYGAFHVCISLQQPVYSSNSITPYFELQTPFSYVRSHGVSWLYVSSTVQCSVRHTSVLHSQVFQCVPEPGDKHFPLNCIYICVTKENLNTLYTHIASY